MQSKVIASSSLPVPGAAQVKRSRIKIVRKFFSTALLTFLAASSSQAFDSLTHEKKPSNTSSPATSVVTNKSMENTHPNAAPVIPQMTAEEASRRMLDLLGNIKTAEGFSAKNLEAAMGLKVYLDDKNPRKYGVGAKITDTWFFNISVILNKDDSKRGRLIFSFDDQTHSAADMTPVCQVDFDAYSKRLTELGFQSEPYYGEHNRLVFWNFSRDNIHLQISFQGESMAKVQHNCVSMLVVDVVHGGS
ncbi:hypothetical protein [Undibacterium pigrum]|uniref:Uncharacterized protein n=1 Tax=Undibacterium pigrum TaxID=401470 RepID=A0A318J954_9BURK|nr:hypothetical protein [Undibacterium pigrum]PXX43849.1 hypothetical protein DFR42_103117 [Undibacterium pigrum]